LASCGGAGDDEFPDAVAIGLPENPESENSSDQNSGDSSLVGTWLLGCGITELGSNSTLNLTFDSSGNVVSVYTQYEDTGCVDADYRLEVKANYTLEDEMIISSGETVQNVSFTNYLLYMALLNEQDVAENNSNSHCGISDWQLNEAVLIPDYCTPSTNVNYASDFYRVDGTRLYRRTYSANDPFVLGSDYLTRMAE